MRKHIAHPETCTLHKLAIPHSATFDGLSYAYFLSSSQQLGTHTRMHARNHTYTHLFSPPECCQLLLSGQKPGGARIALILLLRLSNRHGGHAHDTIVCSSSSSSSMPCSYTSCFVIQVPNLKPTKTAQDHMLQVPFKAELVHTGTMILCSECGQHGFSSLSDVKYQLAEDFISL